VFGQVQSLLRISNSWEEVSSQERKDMLQFVVRIEYAYLPVQNSLLFSIPLGLHTVVQIKMYSINYESFQFVKMFIMTDYGPEIRFPAGTVIFSSSPSPGKFYVTPSPLFSGLKLLEHEADHSSISSAAIRNRWSCRSSLTSGPTCCLRLRVMVLQLIIWAA
jgi:hypothetical protein